MKTGARENHVEDGVLIQLVDANFISEETFSVEGHISHCAVCRSALDGFQRDSRLLSRALRQTDFPAPASISLVKISTRSPVAFGTGWYIAASIVLLIGLGVSPAGALVANTFRQAITFVLNGDSESGMKNSAQQPANQVRPSVAFQPGTNRVALHVPEASTLNFRPASDELVRVSASEAGAEFIVSGNELEIVSGNEEPTELRVWVPANVDRLSILSNGRVVTELAVAELDQMRTLGQLEIQVEP